MLARLAAALLPVLVAVSAGAGPVAHAADPTPALTIDGAPLQLAAAPGSARTVDAGLYRSTLPAGESTLYAAVDRRPGESLSVSVTGAVREPGRPYFATADHTLEVDLVVPSRYGTADSCGSTPSGASARVAQGDPLGNLTAATFLDPGKTERTTFLADGCVGRPTVFVQISRNGPAAAGPMPVEIQVSREPRLTGAPDQAATAAELTAPQTLPKSDEVTVTPGKGFSDAAVLPADGTTRLDVGLSRLYYFKVRVGWGQRLGAVLQSPRAGSRQAPQVDTEVGLTLRSPQRLPLGSQSAAQTAGATVTPDVAEVSTVPVRWSNRNVASAASGSISSSSAQLTTSAGWYYVIVSADPSRAEETRTGVAPYPVQLTVQVTGTAGRGPQFVNASGQPLASPPPGALSVGGSQESGDPASSGPPWTRIAGAAAVALLAAGAVVWALRARRRG